MSRALDLGERFLGFWSFELYC